MLQAESSCARDWRVPDLTDKIPAERVDRVVRKTVYKVNDKRKLYVKSAFILFGYALLLVYLCIKSATLGYQIENMKLDIQNLETANHRLEYQIAEKSSLARVEQVAASSLGMYKPDTTTSIAMEVETEPVQVASAAAPAPADKSVSQKILNIMYNSLSHLAQK